MEQRAEPVRICRGNDCNTEASAADLTERNLHRTLASSHTPFINGWKAGGQVVPPRGIQGLAACRRGCGITNNC
ncbi:hypothetical protein GCM10027048_16180 [Hymenobacter coalescens]